MNKYMLLISAALTLVGSVCAQSLSIEEVLNRVEVNNKELQSNAQLVASQKLANKTDNNLPDPTLSYAHLWGEKESDETIGELVVSQSFDFPTLYSKRGEINRLKSNALDVQAQAMRQQVLLQAKEICLDILMLQQQQQLLNERLKQAEELAAYYQRRLETGDANVLETNKITLELLNVRTEARLSRTTLDNKWLELVALNGNQPLGASALSEFPLCPLPIRYEELSMEVMATDPALLSLNEDSKVARKQIAASKQGWLPKFELGYRRNKEAGVAFNGVVVGFSFPLFENQNKVKLAKAQATYLDFQKENSTLQVESSLAQLYREARSLQTSMQEYQEVFQGQQNLALLNKALTGGQISVIEYFVEVAVIYQSKQNLLQLENQYQKIMAQIYKSTL